jgi:hypothetical protein
MRVQLSARTSAKAKTRRRLAVDQTFTDNPLVRRIRPTAPPPPRLPATLAVVLCLSAIAATPSSTLLAAAPTAPTRPLLQPRDEKVLSELLATLRDAARQMAQPAALADRAAHATPRIADAKRLSPMPEPPVLRSSRGDYRAHLLNLPPPTPAA